METKVKPYGNVVFFLKTFLFTYLFSILCLLILSFLLYKIHLSEKVINVGIILIYIFSTFLGGFIAGKKMKSKKFLWGILMGSGYFLVLALVSYILKQGVTDLSGNFLSALFLCVGSGMLGGMVS